jgi:hypothetical protein
MKQIIIDAEDESNDFAVLIINYPTGVHYTAQCGGLGCSHPTLEGFTIPLWLMVFDDCSYGCHHISYREAVDLREKLSKDLDVYLKKETEMSLIKLSFDFGNIEHLEEGWWPVIIKGRIGNIENFEGTGIVHTGNCD